MKLVSGSAMKALDHHAIETVGIPSLVLMENAGRGVVSIIKKTFPNLERSRVVVFAGKGNNGGDGLVVARVLSNLGIEVDTFILAEPNGCSNETSAQHRILKQSNIPITFVPDSESLQRIDAALDRAAVVVDALLGIGIRGAVRGYYADAISRINDASVYRVALDVPSGLDADIGHVEGVCVKADLTVTLGLPKTGLLFYPGRAYAGRIKVASIGYPETLCEEFASELTWLDRNYVQSHLPTRSDNSHKGSFGKMMLVAGARGMSGAALLAAQAALRSGVGLVHLVYPESLDSVISSNALEAIKHPLPETDGALDEDALDRVLPLLEDMDVVAVGPGLSQQPATQALVCRLLEAASVPMVIDADGLNALVGNLKRLEKRQAPTVLTPHPGEFSRLTELSVDDIETDRLEVARQFSKKYNVALVLKGVPTVIAVPTGEAYVNSTGNSGLAKGGSGDVLTGLIAALWGQGLSATAAAACGVWLHGYAADQQRNRFGERALLPHDLIDILPQIFRSFEASPQMDVDVQA